MIISVCDMHISPNNNCPPFKSYPKKLKVCLCHIYLWSLSSLLQRKTSLSSTLNLALNCVVLFGGKITAFD